MDNLAQFLRAQLDEDERIARAVDVPPDWHQGPGDDPEWGDESMVCMWPPEFHTRYEEDKHWRGLTVESPELAAHIAAHDPARVLAEVEAKRMLLDSIVPTMNAFEDKIDEEWGTGEGEHASAAFLRAWARAYRSHPDFDPAWLED